MPPWLQVNLQVQKCTVVVYSDFKKASDSVPRSKLLIKLQSYGLTENLLTWITNFFFNCSQRINICEKGSANQYCKIVFWVPLYFLLFVNDVGDIFNNHSVSFKLYSDIKLYSCYYVASSCDDLSVVINQLREWSDNWQLIIAVQKYFTCSICSQKQSYKINNSALIGANFVQINVLTILANCYYYSLCTLPTHNCILMVSVAFMTCFQ